MVLYEIFATLLLIVKIPMIRDFETNRNRKRYKKNKEN